jgi:hypothetical protein
MVKKYSLDGTEWNPGSKHLKGIETSDEPPDSVTLHPGYIANTAAIRVPGATG